MSATADVHVALLAALRADAQLSTALGATPTVRKVFFGEAPAKTAPPYVVFPSATENAGDAQSFTARAFAGTETARVTSTDLTGLEGKRIHRHLDRILDGRALALPDHVQFAGSVTYVTDFIDPDPIALPDGTSARVKQTVGRYAWQVVAVSAA